MQMQRTQISLPRTLRTQIDHDRRERKESLSEYMRKSAGERLTSKQNEKKRLAKLADELIGSIKVSDHPEWSTRKKVMAWQRKIRREKGI